MVVTKEHKIRKYAAKPLPSGAKLEAICKWIAENRQKEQEEEKERLELERRQPELHRNGRTLCLCAHMLSAEQLATTVQELEQKITELNEYKSDLFQLLRTVIAVHRNAAEQKAAEQRLQKEKEAQEAAAKAAAEKAAAEEKAKLEQQRQQQMQSQQQAMYNSPMMMPPVSPTQPMPPAPWQQWQQPRQHWSQWQGAPANVRNSFIRNKH